MVRKIFFVKFVVMEPLVEPFTAFGEEKTRQN
jgi:hypothetical protein